MTFRHTRPTPPRGLATLREVGAVFLKLGTTAFGGPAAHVGFMRDEVVRRRRWLSEEEFLDLVGAVQLIPGPNSTELAIHLGYRRAGWVGLVAAEKLLDRRQSLTRSAVRLRSFKSSAWKKGE